MKKDTEIKLAQEDTLPNIIVEDLDDNENADNKQLPPNLVAKKPRKWLPYVITAAILAVVTVLVAWLSGCFTDSDPKTLVGDWSTAFFVPGMFSIGAGLLVVVTNGGTFDIFAYGTRRFFYMFNRKSPLDPKYRGFHEYREAHRGKRRSFWYMIIVGASYLLVAIVLIIVYSQM